MLREHLAPAPHGDVDAAHSHAATGIDRWEDRPTEEDATAESVARVVLRAVVYKDRYASTRP